MIEKIFYKYEDVIESLIPDEPRISPDCNKTILCQATADHKRKCAGKTVSFDWYYQRMKGAVAE